MRKLKFTVAKKLWLGFSAVLFMLVVVGILLLMTMFRIDEEYKHLLNDRVHKVNLVNELISIQKDEVKTVQDLIINLNKKEFDSLKNIDEAYFIVHKKLDDITHDPDTKQLVKEVGLAKTMYTTHIEEALAKMKSQDNTEIRRVANEAEIFNDILMEKASKLKDVQERNMRNARENLDTVVFGATIFTVSLIIVATIISLVIAAAIISRSISRPVRKMTEGLTLIANGNLHIEEMNVRNKDEIGDMAFAFNKMTVDLRSVIQSMNDSAVQLAAQSEQLSASSEESTASSELVAESAAMHMKGSEQQIQIVAHNVLSMTELAKGIYQIGKSNEEMLQSTEKMNLFVDEGAAIVRVVSDQMNDIHSTITETAVSIKVMANHSTDIQHVTSIITDISEQTNLLALNAAIEAARAGEYGKGFAVVAKEVRKLAEQSKQSASEIASMVKVIQADANRAVHSISSGSEKIDMGLQASGKSREIFMKIEKAVNEVGNTVATVSAAIEEVQAVSEEVASGGDEIKKLAEQAAHGAKETNAATEEQLAATEEISSSSQGLATLAVDLQSEVSRFKL
ncbi:methyl-accepting chemotaxis protein [Lederbergia lenta]|uniref:Methyl-accepting chemotaxis sensory transducer n=1 Tax=Lederbergia lenta TaxID=1467 RepID=A0A2X4WLV1_LEDLE|nr:methyl-accepting chemotaxis protein [Lederbergia lenta]MEC2324059.1 methyl-accepting chemotaxis protein [Lederbergia lenta]SQI60718.1 methyl-accepting chemotaxis sensory transducer [Lederbergia lenta]